MQPYLLPYYVLDAIAEENALKSRAENEEMMNAELLNQVGLVGTAPLGCLCGQISRVFDCVDTNSTGSDQARLSKHSNALDTTIH